MVETKNSAEVDDMAKTKTSQQIGFVGLKLGDLKESLERAASEEGKNVSEFCRDAIEAALAGNPGRKVKALMRSFEMTKRQAEVALKSGLEKEELQQAQAKVKDLMKLLKISDIWPL